MTGSSGGLIGATYFRQVDAVQRQGGNNRVNDPAHLDAMASDILNPLGFSFVSNDMFIRYRRVHDGMRSYTLDRGYAFEKRINELTDTLFGIRRRACSWVCRWDDCLIQRRFCFGTSRRS